MLRAGNLHRQSLSPRRLPVKYRCRDSREARCSTTLVHVGGTLRVSCSTPSHKSRRVSANCQTWFSIPQKHAQGSNPPGRLTLATSTPIHPLTRLISLPPYSKSSSSCCDRAFLGIDPTSNPTVKPERAAQHVRIESGATCLFTKRVLWSTLEEDGS